MKRKAKDPDNPEQMIEVKKKTYVYVLPPLDQCRELLERLSNRKIDWPTNEFGF